MLHVFSIFHVFVFIFTLLETQVNPQRDQSAFCNPPLGELQKKAHIYMIAVASSPVSSGFTLEDVVQSYAIYDWTTPSTGEMRRQRREEEGRGEMRRET